VDACAARSQLPSSDSDRSCGMRTQKCIQYQRPAVQIGEKKSRKPVGVLTASLVRCCRQRSERGPPPGANPGSSPAAQLGCFALDPAVACKRDCGNCQVISEALDPRDDDLRPDPRPLLSERPMSRSDVAALQRLSAVWSPLLAELGLRVGHAVAMAHAATGRRRRRDAPGAVGRYVPGAYGGYGAGLVRRHGDAGHRGALPLPR
jgi:hypothetical protein